MKILKTLLLAIAIAAPALGAAAKDTLTIGTTQFPSSFHPNIDSMLAKSYILGMTRRPLTMHSAKWKLGCMLCETLPTLENGLARLETTPVQIQNTSLTITASFGVAQINLANLK